MTVVMYSLVTLVMPNRDYCKEITNELRTFDVLQKLTKRHITSVQAELINSLSVQVGTSYKLNLSKDSFVIHSTRLN